MSESSRQEKPKLSAMSRPKLHLAQSPRKPSLSTLKAALRKWKRPGVPKAIYRHNALSWLRSVQMLGPRHLLKGGKPKWGIPGDVVTSGIHAPRRLGEQA